MLSAEPSDPWDTPPDWMPLSDAMKWLAHRFQIEPDHAFIQELKSGVRARHVEYRIEIEPRIFANARLPRGMDFSDRSQNVVVDSWDLVAVDWANGTVKGWTSGSDSPPDRCRILLYWPALERWAMSPLSALRMRRDRAAKQTSAGRAMLPGAAVSAIRETPAPQLDPQYSNIDDAVGQTTLRLACPGGPATKRLLEAFASGDIRTWRWVGRPTMTKLLPKAWEGADIDLAAFKTQGSGGLIMGGTVYHLHNVIIAADDLDYWLSRQAPAAAQTTPADPAPKNRTTNGRDYRNRDAPLVDRMHELIKRQDAGSPEDAARAVVDDAAGNGAPDSKVKRLALRYREKHTMPPVE